MYTLESAIGKTLADRGRWINADIGNVPFVEIYATYDSVKAILSNPFIDHPVCLDLADVRVANNSNNQTFNEWLVANGATALPTSDVIPVIKNRYARYADAFHAGYKLKPVHPTASPDAEVTPDERTSIFLSRTGLDFNLFRKHCLVSVNGYLHYTDATSQGAWVMDGMRTVRYANENQVGIISFLDVGEIKSIRITEDMIYKQQPDQRYRDRVTMVINEDISKKTILMSIGGYLHIQDPNTFHRIGDNIISIDFSRLNFIERYHESMKTLDLTSLPIQRTEANPTQIVVDDFLSDANILAYLTLPQSFIVLIDNPEVFVDHQFVKPAMMPGYLIAYTPPVYPLINGVGKMAEYWYTYEDQQYSIKVRDNWTHHRLYDTTKLLEEKSVSDSRVPNKPVSFSGAYFLKIGTNN